MVLNTESSAERTPSRNPHEAAERSRVIPGSAEQAARDVQAVSPEGRPADPNAGPAKLRGERVIAALLVIAIVAAASVYWIGWFAGIAALVVGGMALFFNPVMFAAGQRAEDRAEVIERRVGGTPGGPVHP